MKNIFQYFSSLIALVCEIAILGLSIIWYYNTKEIEPICVGIAAFTAIIGSLSLRMYKKGESIRNLDINDINSTSGKISILKKGKLDNEKIRINQVKGMSDINIDIKDE